MRRKASGLGSFWGVGGSVLSGAIMLFVAIAAARGDVRLPDAAVRRLEATDHIRKLSQRFHVSPELFL